MLQLRLPYRVPPAVSQQTRNGIHNLAYYHKWLYKIDGQLRLCYELGKDPPNDPFLVYYIRHAANRGKATQPSSDLQLFDNSLVSVTQDRILSIIPSKPKKRG